jgi:N-acetylglucosamine kinase-like BadF-type ATPase
VATRLVVGLDVGGTKLAIRTQSWDTQTTTDRALSAAGRRVEPAAEAAPWLLDRIRESTPPRATVEAVAVGAQRCNTDECARALEVALRERGVAATVLNDAMLVGLDEGLGVIAGTGSIAVGRTAEGRFVMAGGWGWVLGDEGGAVTLVRAAARAALLARDEGAEDHELLRRLEVAFDVADPDELTLSITVDPSPAHVGPAAPAVFPAADAGSTLARDVIAEAASALASLVDRLLRKGAAGRVVVAAGGVMTGRPRFFLMFRERVLEAHPDLDVRLLEAPPVAGALVRARRLAEREGTGSAGRTL